MIRIVTAKTLAALRAAAADVPALRRSAENEAEARRAADAALLLEQGARADAEAARTQAMAGLDAARNHITAELARLGLAASDTSSGEAVKAEIALHVLRRQIAEVKASGDPAALDSIRVLDMLIGRDLAPAPPAGNPEQPEKPVDQKDSSVPADDPIRKYHHPHFISAQHKEWGTYYQFREFTGHEPEPEAPDAAWKDDSLTWEERRLVSREYSAAREGWLKARFRRAAVPAVKEAVPVWQAYRRARSAMDALFSAFWETDDNHWRAQVLRLVDAHDQALQAAEAWDRAAAPLARLAYRHFREVGEDHELDLKDVATDAGIDITDWPAEFFYNCYGDRYADPLADDVRDAISMQMDRLRQAAELAPVRSTET